MLGDKAIIKIAVPTRHHQIIASTHANIRSSNKDLQRQVHALRCGRICAGAIDGGFNLISPRRAFCRPLTWHPIAGFQRFAGIQRHVIATGRLAAARAALPAGASFGRQRMICVTHAVRCGNALTRDRMASDGTPYQRARTPLCEGKSVICCSWKHV